MPDEVMRLRVERILRDRFRPDDLMALFLYARDRCDGREAVREIGDFVAHHNERYKGILTRRVREFFAIAQFYAPLVSGGSETRLDWDRMPSCTPDYLRATSRRSTNESLRAAGLSKPKVDKNLSSIIDRLIPNADGTFKANPENQLQSNILLQLCTKLIVTHAFDGAELVDGFRETFRSNALLRKDEYREFAKLSAPICIFAIAIMHRCSITLGDGLSSTLTAWLDQGKLAVSASVPAIRVGEPNEIKFSCSIFITDLDKTHCDTETLLSKDIFAEPIRWDFPLELSRYGKLARFV